MIRERGLKPWELERLTIPEITLLLDDGKERKPFWSEEQMFAESQRWAALTPEEKIREYLDDAADPDRTTP